MTLTDWLLSLHVLSAVALVGGLTALWAVVLATRPAGAGPAQVPQLALARPLTAVVGVGMLGTLVFGIWLAIDIDAYEIWDPWIVAALVLWVVGGGLGDRTGRVFAETPTTPERAREQWRRGTLLHAGSSVAAVVVLVLMIWKPGA